MTRNRYVLDLTIVITKQFTKKIHFDYITLITSYLLQFINEKLGKSNVT